MSPVSYEIRVVGEVPPRMLEDFERVTVSHQAAESTIHLALADEAELHGLLQALGRDGYALIELRRNELDRAEDWTDGEPTTSQLPSMK